MGTPGPLGRDNIEMFSFINMFLLPRTSDEEKLAKEIARLRKEGSKQLEVRQLKLSLNINVVFK